MRESYVPENVIVCDHEGIPTGMNCLVDCGDCDPTRVIVGNLKHCAFDELVSNIPSWVGKVSDSGELDSQAFSNIDAYKAG